MLDCITDQVRDHHVKQQGVGLDGHFISRVHNQLQLLVFDEILKNFQLLFNALVHIDGLFFSKLVVLDLREQKQRLIELGHPVCRIYLSMPVIPSAPAGSTMDRVA